MSAREDTPDMAAAPPAGGALVGYQLPWIPPRMELILTLAFVVFIVSQTLEAPLRYAFSLVGAGWLIYLRDLAVLAAMLALAVWQLWRHRLQGAFLVFAVLVFFHGVVSFLLCHVAVAVLVSMKTLLSPLLGAVFLPILMKNKRGIGWLLALLWLVTAAGIAVDYAGWHLPWKGLSSEVGDYTVVINKKWNYQGEDRIGGFSRDSVGASMLVSFFSLYALIFSRSILLRLIAAIGGLALIYITTSKGCVVAFGLVILACLLPMKRSQLLNKAMLATVFAAMTLLPIVLPNYTMPSSPAFLRSFYDRVERVWPDTWHNIDQHSWIFGSAMGNVGVGQQYLKFEDVNTGDNLFVLSYGYFGVFCILYLGWPFLAALRRQAPVDALGRYAIVTLIYVFAYGIVVNIIEGPVAAFMLGSAVQALAMRKTAPARELAAALAVPAGPQLGRRASTT
jgi:hypothetical protein